MARGKRRVAGKGGEGLLDAALTVVKIAAHGADRDVCPFLGDHLGALHGADALAGEEHEDPRAVNVVKALQRGLSRVAGGGRQHHALARLALPGPGGGDQLRQHRKRHVLEGGGGAAEQLQNIVAAYLDQRRQLVAFKFPGISLPDQLVHAVQPRQQMGEQHGLNPQRVLLQTEAPVKGLTAQRRVDKQAAVRRDPPQDRLRCVGLRAAAGTYINHDTSLPLGFYAQ